MALLPTSSGSTGSTTQTLDLAMPVSSAQFHQQLQFKITPTLLPTSSLGSSGDSSSTCASLHLHSSNSSLLPLSLQSSLCAWLSLHAQVFAVVSFGPSWEQSSDTEKSEMSALATTTVRQSSLTQLLEWLETHHTPGNQESSLTSTI